MTLKSKFYYLASPRKVRGFASAIMALIGILAVIGAILFTQEANADIVTLAEQLSHTPVALVVELIKSIF